MRIYPDVVALPVCLLALGACERKKEVVKEVIIEVQNSVGDFRDVKDAPASVRAVGAATVLIDDNGTASFVEYSGRHFLMTNHHVLSENGCSSDGCYVSIVTDFERGSKATVRRLFLKPVAANADVDVSFFSFEPVDNDYAPTNAWAPTAFLKLEEHSAAELIGKNINLVGHPGVGLKKWTSGKVIVEENRYIGTTSFAIGGSSGSPVVTDEGVLVAIHHSGNREINDISPKTFNRVSRHSPTSLLIPVLREALSATPGSLVSSFVPLNRELLPLPDALEIRRYVKARKALTFASPDMTQEKFVEDLQTQCTAALEKQERTPASSSEALSRDLESCTVANILIACKDRTKNPAHYCPGEVAKSGAWEELFVRVADAWGTYPGSSATGYRGFPIADLFQDKIVGSEHARRRFMEGLARTSAPMSFKSALTLIKLGGASEVYQGKSIRDYVVEYKKNETYWREIESIIPALDELASEKLLTEDELRAAFRKLATDSRLTLANRLDLEATAFWWNMLW